MPTNVVMPQMGESIAEGTIVRWIKKVGDTVDRDEPLFEISTDKVDAEIPSPAAGVLTEIRAKEGETVPVNRSSRSSARPGRSRPRAPAAGALPQQRRVGASRARRRAAIPAPECGARVLGRRPRRRRPPHGAVARGTAPAEVVAARAAGSPREHDVDIGQLPGTGISGRVTKQDILGFIESGAARRRPLQTGRRVRSRRPRRTRARAPFRRRGASSRARSDEVVPMTVMRRKIAEHMVMSKRTSAHVHSVFEVNFSTWRRSARRRRPSTSARAPSSPTCRSSSRPSSTR